MKRLTAKEEEVMGFFWEKGPLFVKQLLEFYVLSRASSALQYAFHHCAGAGRERLSGAYGIRQYVPIPCRCVERRIQARDAEKRHQQVFQQFLLRSGLFAGKGRGDFDRGTERAYQASGGREISFHKVKTMSHRLYIPNLRT